MDVICIHKEEDPMNKPLIGVSCNMEEKLVSKINHRYVQTLSNTYIKAVEAGGGIPVIIPNSLNEEDLKTLADRLDGFIFSGGGDVDPAVYGGLSDETVGGVSDYRDETELALLKYVINETDKPVFGICRGVQIMNVEMGGTLIVDLPKAGKMRHSLTEYPREEFTHEIRVEEGSRLKEILKDENRVNSFHHQALDKVADGLFVTAYSVKDGVIEAVENRGERYILGVQWHPEELIAHEGHLALFKELVRQAKK